MLKKILLTLFVIFLLSSCFWISSDTEQDLWLDLYEVENFSIFIPSTWEIISDEEKILPKPTVWTIDLSVASSTSVWWFYNNLLVLWEDLNTDLLSSEYSSLNNVWSKWEYFSYKLLEEKDIDFDDNSSSKLYIFEAKYNENTPKVSFIQTAVVCPENKWYLITLWLNTEILNFTRYENIIKTFSCK